MQLLTRLNIKCLKMSDPPSEISYAHGKNLAKEINYFLSFFICFNNSVLRLRSLQATIVQLCVDVLLLLISNVQTSVPVA
jgi:hypothetical protein